MTYCKCDKPELNINYLCKKCGKPIKINYEQEKRVKCALCNNPIHITKFAGISKKGLLCNNLSCLKELVK